MNKRDEQIATLKGNTDELDKGRLADFYQQIVDGYERESIVDRLAHVETQTDRTPADFRVLTHQETRRLSDFNDPAYYWDIYCEQFGRSIAIAEERYVFEKMAELPRSELTVDASKPRFSVIQEAVERVKGGGYDSSVIFAPIALFVPFNTDASLKIDRDSDPREALVMADGRRLPVIWSSNAAPLTRFVVADTAAGLWTVKRDPETGHRLTVAIGRPESRPQAVVFLAETVAKYEIADPRGFCVIDVEGEPPDEYDMTRQ